MTAALPGTVRGPLPAGLLESMVLKGTARTARAGPPAPYPVTAPNAVAARPMAGLHPEAAPITTEGPIAGVPLPGARAIHDRLPPTGVRATGVREAAVLPEIPATGVQGAAALRQEAADTGVQEAVRGVREA